MLDDNVSDELAICEGVETGMAAHLLGIRPVWALGSTGGIKLRVVGERDRASALAVAECGRHWKAAGRWVRIIMPPPNCKDLNDALRICP